MGHRAQNGSQSGQWKSPNLKLVGLKIGAAEIGSPYIVVGMSLTLLQSYSSAEEDEDVAGEGEEQPGYDKSEDEDDDGENGTVPQNRYKPLFDPNPSSSSSLPSALDAFSEVRFVLFS